MRSQTRLERMLRFLLARPYRCFKGAFALSAFLFVPIMMMSWGQSLLDGNMELVMSTMSGYGPIRYRPNLPGAIVYYGVLLMAPALATAVANGVNSMEPHNGEAGYSEAQFERAFIMGILAALVGLVIHLAGVRDAKTMALAWGCAYGVGITNALIR